MERMRSSAIEYVGCDESSSSIVCGSFGFLLPIATYEEALFPEFGTVKRVTGSNPSGPYTMTSAPRPAKASSSGVLL